MYQRHSQLFSKKLTVALLIRTVQSDSNEETCYFNIRNKDEHFNSFLNKGSMNSNLKENAIYFQIDRVQSRGKDSQSFDAIVQLKSLVKNGA